MSGGVVQEAGGGGGFTEISILGAPGRGAGWDEG